MSLSQVQFEVQYYYGKPEQTVYPYMVKSERVRAKNKRDAVWQFFLGWQDLHLTGYKTGYPPKPPIIYKVI